MNSHVLSSWRVGEDNKELVEVRGVARARAWVDLLTEKSQSINVSIVARKSHEEELQEAATRVEIVDLS